MVRRSVSSACGLYGGDGLSQSFPPRELRSGPDWPHQIRRIAHIEPPWASLFRQKCVQIREVSPLVAYSTFHPEFHMER